MNTNACMLNVSNHELPHVRTHARKHAHTHARMYHYECMYVGETVASCNTGKL